MSCRICKGKLKKIINLGKIGLVGSFYRKKSKSKKFKISLNFCVKCKHVQINEKLNPDLLFRNYLWETGISKSNISLINNLIKSFKKFKMKKGKKLKFFEIACNDGIFLSILQKKLKCFAAGIDPAKNLINKNKVKNIIRIPDYFDRKTSQKIKLKLGNFDYIIARNVLAHVRNPNEIFKGVFNILSPNGVFIVEFPSLLNIIKYNQYDNIFHEHIGFHSLKSILDLCKLNNLKLINVDNVSSQGGSLRCYITTKNSKLKKNKILNKIYNTEKRNGLYETKTLLDFKNKINHHRELLNRFLKKIKNKNKKISAYGASGKGQALMEYCKIDNKIIDAIYDKSKLKQNKYTSGTNIIIKNPSYISKKKIDFLLLLSWNIKKEIMKQEKKFIINGGKFIIPFPKPKLLG